MTRHIRPTVILTSVADKPAPPPLPRTALQVGYAAAVCPRCGNLVRALTVNDKNPLLPKRIPIFGRHTVTGHVPGRDGDECDGTYTRARDLVTYQGTFDEWWLTYWKNATDTPEHTVARSIAREAWEQGFERGRRSK